MKKSNEFATRMVAEIAWGAPMFDVETDADREARRARWERRKRKTHR